MLVAARASERGNASRLRVRGSIYSRLVFSPDTRRLLREQRVWLVERARWGFAIVREDDADCTSIERWALAQMAEAIYIDGLLAR